MIFCQSIKSARKMDCCIDRAEFCCADKCMGWRRVETNIKEDGTDDLVPSDDTHGFCGRAGNPKTTQRQ